ncbi:MAG: flippase-like domain-containing protein [Candidatus Altiarchaeales archaeon]|nr:flippase-like domain-containing protein [Candidatus Altiarchaeota archaeon]MCG2783188.1 flippase-like domain-containing protein [Candidatus Altiarchaeales archaeon]
MKPKKIFRSIFVILITLLVFYLIFKTIDFHTVVNILFKASPFWLMIAGFLSVLSLMGTSKRWQIILNTIGYEISFSKSLRLILATYPLNSIMPSKSGDFIRAYYLRGKISISKTTGSIIAERIFDILLLASLSLIGAVYYGNKALIAVVLLVILAIIIAFVVANKNFNLPIKPSWNKKLNNLALSIEQVSKNRIAFIKIVMTSIGIWILAIIQFHVLFSALGIEVPWFSIIANLPIAVFVGLIPVTLGGMGTRDAAIILLFSGFATNEELMSVGILFSFFRMWLLSFLGLPLTQKLTRGIK